MMGYTDIYEWEWLYSEQALSGFYTAVFYDNEGTELLTLEGITGRTWRGDNYDINVEISGSHSSTLEILFKSIPNQTNLRIISNTQYPEYIFSNLIADKRNVNFESNPAFYSLKLKFEKLQVKFDDIGKTSIHNEWYLNGVTNYISLNNRRELSQELKCSWKINDSITEREIVKSSQSFSLNTAIIKGSEIPTFLLSSVPKKFGEFSSKNTTIEYLKEFGDIPDKNTRKSIEEITSFVIGNQLVNIGYTCYDESGNVIEIGANKPESHLNLDTLRTTPSKFMPVNLNIRSDGENIEEILPPLLKAYFEKKDELLLDIVFYSYWLSQTLPFEYMLPVLQNGFEILVKRLLGQDETKQLTFRNNDKEGSKQRSGFFDAVKHICEDIFNIKVGDLEKAAYKLRHEMTHSRIKWESMSYDDKKESYTQLLAYYTLYNRMILRSLGYEGNYIDWATTWFSPSIVSRPIIENSRKG